MNRVALLVTGALCAVAVLLGWEASRGLSDEAILELYAQRHVTQSGPGARAEDCSTARHYQSHSMIHYQVHVICQTGTTGHIFISDRHGADISFQAGEGTGT